MFLNGGDDDCGFDDIGNRPEKKRNETERYLPMYPLKWPMINN